MSLDELREMFDTFEKLQFPGFPDDPLLQEAYDELVENGSQLTGVIQRLIAGKGATADEVPSFDVDISASEDEDAAEFRHYRAAVDALVAKVQSLIDDG